MCERGGVRAAYSTRGVSVAVARFGPKIVIKRFALNRPVPVELMLDTAAGYPADLGRAESAVVMHATEVAERGVRLEPARRQTTGDINQRVVNGQTHPPAERCQPIYLGLVSHNTHPTGLSLGLFETGPGPIRCDAIDEVAILPIIADFDTAHETRRAGRARGIIVTARTYGIVALEGCCFAHAPDTDDAGDIRA